MNTKLPCNSIVESDCLFRTLVLIIGFDLEHRCGVKGDVYIWCKSVCDFLFVLSR